MELLQDQVVDLHWKWHTYRYLFTGPEAEQRIELLNKSAEVFFGFVQRMLADDVFLGLGRLMDAEEMDKRENLSLPRLRRQVSALKGDQGKVKEGFERRFKEVRRLLKKAIKHRHRRIAHTDLRSHPGVRADTLPSVTPPDIDRALAGVSELLNFLDGEFRDLHVAYDDVDERGGAEVLIQTLERAADRLQQLLDEKSAEGSRVQAFQRTRRSRSS